ncbi:hypothetical protein M422DRAFT_270323 [Sphaerobolus stellatus SS14]|uniref:Uncharacterized protein n=1 Tax=Sphaerobolus stellatus (strain SS14) TaxID=990650 RepID=A0A0C9U2N8_SPHS4|nr:hypothetical protein M422DRAFT_270323 [Sphaerobolus stellatus SS14]
MLDTVLDALLGTTMVKAFVEELEPWRNDGVAEFVKASGGRIVRVSRWRMHRRTSKKMTPCTAKK